MAFEIVGCRETLGADLSSGTFGTQPYALECFASKGEDVLSFVASAWCLSGPREQLCLSLVYLPMSLCVIDLSVLTSWAALRQSRCLEPPGRLRRRGSSCKFDLPVLDTIGSFGL